MNSRNREWTAADSASLLFRVDSDAVQDRRSLENRNESTMKRKIYIGLKPFII